MTIDHRSKQMTEDRLHFDSVELPNGIIVHFKTWSVPFADMRIYVPLGHLHCCGAIPGGSAHILEHVLTHSSPAFPLDRSFERFIEENGGDHSASTAEFATAYMARIASPHSQRIFEGLVSQVFEPNIEQEYVEAECRTVGIERTNENRWYPSNSELGHHLRTQWYARTSPTLQQLYGDETDRKKITEPLLKNVHALYRRKGVHVYVGGSFDRTPILRTLEAIEPLQDVSLQTEYRDVMWKNQSYSERAFADIENFTYYIAAITDPLDYVKSTFLDLFDRLMTNFTFGPLYKWLRHDQQWLYTLGAHYYHNPPFRCVMGLQLELGEKEYVQVVRREIAQRMHDAIVNDELVGTMIDRMLKSNVFKRQTIESVLSEARDAVYCNGSIVTEKEDAAHLDAMRSKNLRLQLFEEHWQTKNVGEFLAMPERS